MLYSIDSNIGIFKNKNLYALAVGWLKSFPPIQKRQVDKTVNVSFSLEGPKFEARIHQKPNTLEEKIALLEKKLNWLEADFKKDSQLWKKSIESLNSTNNDKFKEIENKALKISTQLEQVSIGSVKLQLLGVILLVYGSVVSYVA